MGVDGYVKDKFDVITLKGKVNGLKGKGNRGRVYVQNIVSGSHGRYVGHVLCSFLNLTPRQLGVEEYVEKGLKDSLKVDYVEVADKYGLDEELFDPFISHFEWINAVSDELGKQLGVKAEIDVLEADNSVGIFVNL